jgi:hypothetical protein
VAPILEVTCLGGIQWWHSGRYCVLPLPLVASGPSRLDWYRLVGGIALSIGSSVLTDRQFGDGMPLTGFA